MSIDTSRGNDLNTMTVFDGAFTAIRSYPLILGLFLLSGVLRIFLPSVVGLITRFSLMSIGIVVAYQALDGQIRADSSFVVRLLIAIVILFISVILFFVGGVVFLALGFSGSTWLALISLGVFFLLGMYVYVRLFLAPPAVMIDGYGPVKALSTSWQLTDGSKLTTVAAIILVIIIYLIIIYSLFSQIRLQFIPTIGSTLIVDMLLVSIQAFLYMKLSDASGLPQTN